MIYYTFRSSRGSQVTVLRGDGAPKMVDGGSGWTVEDRPRRVGLTIWKGRNPYRMDVPILIDAWASQDSIENDIAILNQMQMGSDLEQPPTVTIVGGVPVKGIVWVLDPIIDWGDNVIWGANSRGDMFRYRQDAVVHLCQYNPEDRLQVSGGGNLQAPRRYIVKQGDDLRSISQKMYGDPTKWKLIQAANNIRDPKRILRMVGKEIRIP